MTIEQALKIKQNWTAEQARNDLERWLLRGERPADKVIALACKALEKQIPKKLVMDMMSKMILNVLIAIMLLVIWTHTIKVWISIAVTVGRL